MNELVAGFVVGGFMAISYLFVYPRAKNVTQLRWLDVATTLAVAAVLALLYWESNPPFSLIFFETNWFVYGLILYIVIETPLWYLYMKKNPQQGTLAQLYGLARASSPKTDAKVAKNIATIMSDTKWDPIRTAKAQKLLVTLAGLSLISSPVLFFLEDSLKPGIGILSIIPIFLTWWLLRISVRLVADTPDKYLDELQIKQRDRTYLHAFRILATIISILAISLMLLVLSMDVEPGSVQYYTLKVTFGQVNAIIWTILGSIILLPNMVLAWNQSKSVSF